MESYTDTAQQILLAAQAIRETGDVSEGWNEMTTDVRELVESCLPDHLTSQPRDEWDVYDVIGGLTSVIRDLGFEINEDGDVREIEL